MLLFVINNMNGQTKSYTFDKIIHSTFSTKNYPNQKHTHLFNSNDYSYHMQIYKGNDSIISRIFDRKNNYTHYFLIENLDSMKLHYLETKRHKKVESANKLKFSNLNDKSGAEKIEFKILNGKNKKIAKYKLEVMEMDSNYFPIYFLSSLDENTEIMIETQPFNFLVLEAKGVNTNGRRVKYSTNSFKDIRLKVHLADN